MGEEERAVLELSGVLPSRKLKGKAKARSGNGPKHVVFVEEGEGGPSRPFSNIYARRFTSTVLLDTYIEPSSPAAAPKTASDNESEVELGWKPEGRQKRNKGKQRSQGPDSSDLQLLEEESEVRCIPFPLMLILIQVVLFRNTDGGWFRSFQLGWRGTNNCVLLNGSWRCKGCSWGKVGRRS